MAYEYELGSSSDDEEANNNASVAVESDDNANTREQQATVVEASFHLGDCLRNRNADTADQQEIDQVQASLLPAPRRSKRKRGKQPDASDVGERKANANTAEQQETAVQASQPPVHRRKPKVAKWPEDLIIVSELKENGLPTDINATRRMRKLAGMIVRQRVSLLLRSLDDVIPEDWNLLIKECVLPYLQFELPVRTAGIRLLIRMIYRSFRNYKSELVRDFVRKGLDPTEKHPYISPQVSKKFVVVQESDEAKKTSKKFSNIRSCSTHEHFLGTEGYDGAAEKWEEQDRYLAEKGIPNPWLKYPGGRPGTYLRGHGKLIVSEGSARISWVSKSNAMLSEQILDKQAELESSGLADTCIRDKDLLVQVLGPEQTGRIRGFSSYCGWKHWPQCCEMYKKRKRADLNMKKLREEVTKDVMGILQQLGVLPSITPPSVGAQYSSDAVSNNVQLDEPVGITHPNPVDVVTLPIYCSLVSNIGGFQVEVARGEVFPQQTELNSEPVQDGYVVVRVDFVSPEHVSLVLNPPPSAENSTLLDALFKSVQWRKCDIVILPKDYPSKGSFEPIRFDRSAKTTLKNASSNVSSLLDEQAKNATTVEDCVTKEHAEGKKQTNSKSSLAPSAKTTRKDLVSNLIYCSLDEKAKSVPLVGNFASKEQSEDKNQTSKKSTRGPAGSAVASRPPMSKTEQGQQVGAKQQQKACRPPMSKTEVGAKQQQKASRPPMSKTEQGQQVGEKQQQKQAGSTKTFESSSLWTDMILPFEFGKRMLSERDLVHAGSACEALHAYYIAAVAENRNTGVGGRLEFDYFLREGPLIMGFEDMYQLLTFEALDVATLRMISLYCIVLSRKNSLPVRILDPDALSISTLQRDRAYSVAYLENCLMACGMEKYVMFAYNAGKHWVAVVIVPDWHKVLFFDSFRAVKTELGPLRSVIDEAYENYQRNKVKPGRPNVKLNHVTKIPCLQQGLDTTCGFYAAHHMLCMMSTNNINAQKSQDLDLTTIPIDMPGIRARIAQFILRFVINPKGKFHLAPGVDDNTNQ